jgi:hypothetical protein
MSNDDVHLVNEIQAAKMLTVSTAALRRWRREGRGPQFVCCERCVRYSLHSIRQFVEQNSSTNKKAADRESAARRGVRHGHATTQT